MFLFYCVNINRVKREVICYYCDESSFGFIDFVRGFRGFLEVDGLCFENYCFGVNLLWEEGGVVINRRS